MSQPLWAGGYPGLEITSPDGLLGSQKSSLLPWDNAGIGSSSSVAGGTFGSDNIPVDHVEIKMRGSSMSRRGSSLAPSLPPGSGPGLSPAPLGVVHASDDDIMPFEGLRAPLASSRLTFCFL